MQQIIFFFLRNKNFLLFLFLFVISFMLTVNSHSYHESKFVTSANFLSGGVYSFKSNITDYFDLEEQNEILTKENERLRAIIANGSITNEGLPSQVLDSNYSFISAKVINNNYARSKNYLTLNKGKQDSLKVDMGVISSQGVVGIINATSNKYASIQSVLNTNSQVVAKFKKSDHYGTLKWDANATNIVQLVEIPRLAPVAVGDTIVTDGKSTIFPEGILIGTVSSFERKPDEDYYSIDVQLFTDMTSVKHVYVISHRDAPEIQQLEKEVENAE
ncbi:MAG: rod shape-determining protein MreC [Flavobacteriaceae bacterium]|nr:rod shape-determining protein MreC [Flavobacteriaceae bacterium]